MPIRRAARHGFTGDIPAGARAVINHHCLAKQRPHAFGDKPRGDIRSPGGREGHHQAQGPRWKALRPRNGRRGKPGNQRDAAGEFDHANLPFYFVGSRCSSTTMPSCPGRVG